jgi:Histidine kinase-like ATPase domain
MIDVTLFGPVEIRIPAEPVMSRVLRLAASGVASLAGCTIDEIEDIKIAVSEVLIALVEHGAGHPVDVQFVVGPESFSIRGRTAVSSFDLSHPDLALCRVVLAEVCFVHDIEFVNEEVHISAAVRRVPAE